MIEPRKLIEDVVADAVRLAEGNTEGESKEHIKSISPEAPSGSESVITKRFCRILTTKRL